MANRSTQARASHTHNGEQPIFTTHIDAYIAKLQGPNTAVASAALPPVFACQLAPSILFQYTIGAIGLRYAFYCFRAIGLLECFVYSLCSVCTVYAMPYL